MKLLSMVRQIAAGVYRDTADQEFDKVQHVVGGETRYFREWAGLIAHLSAMMADAEQKSDRPNA
jgi:hypothetical protein